KQRGTMGYLARGTCQNHIRSERTGLMDGLYDLKDREDRTKGGTEMTGHDYWYAWAIIVAWSGLCTLAAFYIDSLQVVYFLKTVRKKDISRTVRSGGLYHGLSQ